MRLLHGKWARNAPKTPARGTFNRQSGHVSAPNHGQRSFVQTFPSGKPEVLVKESAASAIRAKLLEKCAMRGMQVEEQQSTVSCTKTLGGAAGIAAQMMLGNSYSTTPTQRTTFLVTQRGTDTFVMMTSSAISTQMPGGQVKYQEVSNNGLINEVQTFLDNLQN